MDNHEKLCVEFSDTHDAMLAIYVSGVLVLEEVPIKDTGCKLEVESTFLEVPQALGFVPLGQARPLYAFNVVPQICLVTGNCTGRLHT